MVTWKTDHQGWASQPEKDRGAEPIQARIVTTNVTTEALATMMAANPRGMLLAPDEFSGFLGSMDQYKTGKGGDQSFYLSFWNGSYTSIDRAKNNGRPIAIYHPLLTIVGGMTPGSIAGLASDNGDQNGFMARLLFVFPDPVQGRRYSRFGVPDDLMASWKSILDRLRERMPNDSDGSYAEPHMVVMSPEAEECWADWAQANMDEQDSPDFPGFLEGSWGKLEEYAGRLALILHLLELAADPTFGPNDPIPPLSPSTLTASFRLIGYFKSHARRVYGVTKRTTEGRSRVRPDHIQAVRGYIKRKEKLEFSRRDLTRDTKSFDNDPTALDRTLEFLRRAGAIEAKPTPERDPSTRGRKPTPVYLASPDFLTNPRFDRIS